MLPGFNLLTIPVWAGLLISFFFPYQGLEMSRWGFVVLFVLSLLNVFPFRFGGGLLRQRNLPALLVRLLIAYTLFPALTLLLARFLLEDRSLRLGLLMAALAPVAIVAPSFLARDPEGESAKNRSILYVILSTLLYPLFCLGYLKLLALDGLGIQIWPMMKDVLALTLVPLLISALTEATIPEWKRVILTRTAAILPWLNMAMIGFLVFVYFGSGFAKSNLSAMTTVTWLAIAGIALFQDFGVLGLSKVLGFPRAEQVSFAMKNVALSGGVLLIFHPQATLACSAVFVAHALLFSVLPR